MTGTIRYFAMVAALVALLQHLPGCGADDSGTTPADADAQSLNGPDSAANNDSGVTTDSPSPTPAKGIPMLLSVHLESKTSAKCEPNQPTKGCVDDATFATNLGMLETFLDKLDSLGLKATLEFHLHWLVRMPESELGKALVERLTRSGSPHEIALHHHQFDHPDWDGYSDHPDSLTKPHSQYTWRVRKPMSEYLSTLSAWQTTHNVVIHTMATPEWDYDWDSSAWLLRTEDDADGSNMLPLNDPQKACAKANPKTQTLHLPNGVTSATHPLGMTVHSVLHTWFIGDSVGCQQVLADNVLARIDTLTPATVDKTAVINLVFHLHNYGTEAAITAEFDRFFGELAKRSSLLPMTVKAFACERLAVCP